MLEIRSLTRRFGDLVAVDEVSFTVPPGVLTGFVGGNGAGKTTTMRMVMGVLAMHGGDVLWHGRPVGRADRRCFGYMPEERGLYPKQPVLDQLVYLARLRGMEAATARRDIIGLLDRFGLAGRSKDHLEKLSLGNQQRVQIIAALVPRPSALILDEPFSGLDPSAIDAMAGLLGEQAREGIPVIFSSHQLDLVDRLCDRLVVMAGGRVAAAGSAEELRSGGPLRYRMTLGGDADWLHGLQGLQVREMNGSAALLEVITPGAEQAALAEATRRGPVHEFARVVPTLSEIYQEVTT